MIAWKLKHWRVVGVAAAFGVAACGGESGETGASGGGGEAGEGGEVVAPPPLAPTAQAPAAAAGGEAGEAGAQTAYAGLEGDQRTALRLHHLLGFVLAAERALQDNNVQPMDAAILVQQGVLEVYDAAPTEFGTLNVQSSASFNGGEIAIERANGFAPLRDDAYTVATFGSLAQPISTISGLPPYFQATVSPTSVLLTAVTGGIDLTALSNSVVIPAVAAPGDDWETRVSEG